MSVFVAAVALKQWKLSVLSSRRSKQRGTSVLQEVQRSEEGVLLKCLTRLKPAGFGVPPALWKKRDTAYLWDLNRLLQTLNLLQQALGHQPGQSSHLLSLVLLAWVFGQ